MPYDYNLFKDINMKDTAQITVSPDKEEACVPESLYWE